MEKIISYIIIFAFGFCVYWLVFLICIVLVFFFFFSYITIIVNLYGTAHGKNNQLYNFFFCFWFLCLQDILVLFFLLNAYCTGIFQFMHNRILNKTHKKCKYIMHFKKGILGIWLKYNVIPPHYYIVPNYRIQIQSSIYVLLTNWWIVIVIPL